ncbi:hypothetical protein BDN72DRAFT_892740 [Pluteus cervinus]|uniref:Uncharacterized protein n=1 Tax=Pluteus cervinus TaxID=181527 RepID=A0ACD3BBM9_9AGAR|nr:hypothetical protein BDN72DRAFT_892740 [Pluteus cervinus]
MAINDAPFLTFGSYSRDWMELEGMEFIAGLSRASVEAFAQIILSKPTPTNFIEDLNANGKPRQFLKDRPDVDTFSFERVIAFLQNQLDPSIEIPEDPVVLEEKLRPGPPAPRYVNLDDPFEEISDDEADVEEIDVDALEDWVKSFKDPEMMKEFQREKRWLLPGPTWGKLKGTQAHDQSDPRNEYLYNQKCVHRNTTI